MGITATFTAADVQKMLQNGIDKIEKEIEAKLTRVGNKFVRDARQKADFTDRTGNLRSSIGFILVKNSKEIKADFDKTLNGVDGYAKAIAYARELADQYQGSYVLVVVAGMEYAAKVESRGFDVLTGSSLDATTELNKSFKKR